ncbi:MAG: DotU family type IV/VI secretion system protein [Planctomycetota bacterium]|jgi:type VI secretion system protein ImpK
MQTDVIRLNLADVCSEIFRFAFRMEEALAGEEDANAVQIRVDELFQQLDAAAHQAELSLEDIHQSKYALAAFLDEKVLNSSLPFRDGWARQPLQLKYFDDSAAGEEFYNRLDNLRHSPEEKVPACLEIYLMCLAMGFRGKLLDSQGQEKRKVLIFKIAQELRSAAAGNGDGLTPGPEAPTDRPPAGKPLPFWLLPALSAAFLLLLFFAFSLLLDRSVSVYLDLLQ